MRLGVVSLAFVICLSACSGSEEPMSTGASLDESSKVETTTTNNNQSQIPKLDSALSPDNKSVNVPTSLSIAGLDIVNAEIKPVGVQDNGDMEVPDATSVGWYSFGSSPEQEGVTVLAAHIAESGVDGVFRYLDEVEIGSVVDISLENGETKKYEITALEQFDKTELPFDSIFRRSGEEELVLITCGGDFNPSVRSYEDNVVAFASPL